MASSARPMRWNIRAAAENPQNCSIVSSLEK
jgi:hypothetical protein